jgi:hypothetical protein
MVPAVTGPGFLLQIKKWGNSWMIDACLYGELMA